jgi:hypothetical protein
LEWTELHSLPWLHGSEMTSKRNMDSIKWATVTLFFSMSCTVQINNWIDS